jgi:hypothetical protein
MEDGLLEPIAIQKQAPSKKPKGDGAAKVFWIALALLVLGVGGLFALREKTDSVKTPHFPTPTPLPPPTPTPDPALRAAAEAALGAFMTDFTPLRSERADLWAVQAWTAVLEAQKTADGAMAARDFLQAEAAYREALSRLTKVKMERGTAASRLMPEAKAAYATGDSAASVERLEALLMLEPTSTEAQKLLPRARVADQSFARLTAARDAASLEQWAPAWVELEHLSALDSEFPGTEPLRSQVANTLAAEEFDEWISGALLALSSGDIDRADALLKRAAGFRPEHPAVLDLREQVRYVKVQREVLTLRDRADDLEREEKWREAHEVWLRMKALDEQAPWIGEGRDRTLRWKTLEERIAQATAALLSPQAETLAKEIPTLVELPPGLKTKAETFVRTWTLQHTPVKVRLVSDQETLITLQRVRRWAEPFREQTVELKPGSYVATGTRLGYRDIRVAFEVKPGAADMSIDIRCTEGI